MRIDEAIQIITGQKDLADQLHALRLENQRLRTALNEVVQTCEAGVIHRSETGKPQWSAFSHLTNIARTALDS